MMSFLHFLQINTPIEPVAAPPEELTLAALLMKGGWVMIPILLLWAVALYLFIERYLYLRVVTKKGSNMVNQVKKALLEGDVKTAKMYAEKDNSATGNIILSGLEFVGKPVKDIEGIMESAADIEISEMEKNLGYLGIIAGVAPMLGFIGTISGIIRIFYNISLSDNISIGIIAGGLYEKMITSGSGLVVGVLAYTAYHLLNQKISHFTLRMQKDVFEFVRSILSPAK
ncbi:MAG TPA: MotA/TolQ/ExbB proton channel family protein [Cyclobacteriaceae bacterium]